MSTKIEEKNSTIIKHFTYMSFYKIYGHMWEESTQK